jgi:hypothetical protein
MHKRFSLYGQWESYINIVEARLEDGAKLDQEDQEHQSPSVQTVTVTTVALGKRKTRTDDTEMMELHAEVEGAKGYHFNH